MPEYGFRTGTFRGQTVAQTAAELAGLGFDCLELCLEAPDVRPETLDEARCRQIRQVLAEVGIGLASISYHGDQEPPAERRDNQVRALQIAHWLGTGIVVLNPEKAVDQARQWSEHVAHFKRLCEQAERLDVTLALEPEPLLVVGSSQDMIEMMWAVGLPRLKVNLDVGHAQITDDDLVASVRKLGSAIVHLHLEDIKGRVHRHLPFGEGDIDFVALRQALDEIGYAGPYVVDLFGLDAAPGEVAARALASLRGLFG